MDCTAFVNENVEDGHVEPQEAVSFRGWWDDKEEEGFQKCVEGKPE
jgi:hypothetical protein